jgi:hypothetical protein
VTLDHDRSAALVIRVWLEGGTEGFRARLTTAPSSDPSRPGETRTVAVAASPGEALDAVRSWLEELLRGAAG